MNVERYLVLVKEEDKTEEIISYSFEKGLVKINYKNSPKEYQYSKSNIQFFKNPIEIDCEKNKIVSRTGKIFNVIKILRFDYYYKVFFYDNTSIILSIYEAQIIEEHNINTVSTDKFDYFRKISETIKIKTDHGEICLGQQYKKINFIPNDVVLYKYFNPDIPLNNLKNANQDFIFPFGTNQSQIDAVKNALQSQISIIEGPPGTGKTQTILNIIANIVIRGQTVAVVSNNNSATANVYEKLRNYNLDYLCAQLGKKENKELFIKEQT